VGCNSQVHESNARNLSVSLSLSHTRKNPMSFIFSVFSSSKSENNKAEHVLPGSGIGKCTVAQTMYTHVSKCKIDTIKEKISN
jgi:hypothetical protein